MRMLASIAYWQQQREERRCLRTASGHEEELVQRASDGMDENMVFLGQNLVGLLAPFASGLDDCHLATGDGVSLGLNSAVDNKGSVAVVERNVGLEAEPNECNLDRAHLDAIKRNVVGR